MSASDTPGTGAAVSMPRPLHTLRTRKNLGAGREKEKGGDLLHNTYAYKDARLGALQARAARSARQGQDALCALGKTLGLVGGKGGSNHNPYSYNDANLGALQVRAPR